MIDSWSDSWLSHFSNGDDSKYFLACEQDRSVPPSLPPFPKQVEASGSSEGSTIDLPLSHVPACGKHCVFSSKHKVGYGFSHI